METIEIKVETKKEETFNVSLPLFRKSDTYAFKLLSDKKCIMVTEHKYIDPRIEITAATLAFQFNDIQDCTEGEFQARFNEVMSKLIDLSVK